ncbi:MAG: MFS transporter [Lachnospiraceae bacterium]|nr:MFS transporter [Lachnospiraceae bacterium]
MLPPLLFLIFQDSFSLSLAEITSLVTINFCVQIAVDLIAGKISDRIGYRKLAVFAHFIAAVGLTGFAWIPFVLPSPYIGLLVCIVLDAIGGGLDEVLISPIVEACPDGKNKKTAMALLHSFYCWGVVGVVLLTTLFLKAFGKESWRIACLLWGIVPLLDMFMFMLVPIHALSEGQEGMGYRDLVKSGTFWLLIVLMITAGASEQAMSQWASAFAEKGLGVTKVMGDLLGPCMFAILMGTSRVIYAKIAPRIDTLKYAMLCGGLCIISYLLAAFSPWPILSLLGCALCGLSVGIFWPGFFSTAAVKLPKGGTALFALLAFAGDIGCSGGPTLVGLVSGAHSDDLKTGLFAAIVFPVVLIIASAALGKRKAEEF